MKTHHYITTFVSGQGLWPASIEENARLARYRRRLWLAYDLPCWVALGFLALICGYCWVGPKIAPPALPDPIPLSSPGSSLKTIPGPVSDAGVPLQERNGSISFEW